mgnify:CR=1 FL=1
MRFHRGHPREIVRFRADKNRKIVAASAVKNRDRMTVAKHSWSSKLRKYLTHYQIRPERIYATRLLRPSIAVPESETNLRFFENCSETHKHQEIDFKT